ncbi:MAG: PH domain-containing protein [Acidobacteria bacterium]|nr:PH domain-containing protein [Acidobacteriota bacterium]
MGLLSGLMGNASEVDPAEAQQEFERILVKGEKVRRAFQLIRDGFVFTDKRLILIDKQGMTGNKVEYQSIPWPSIVRFAVESSGTFDLDAELKIWVRGASEPIRRQFDKKIDIYDVQQFLASHVL